MKTNLGSMIGLTLLMAAMSEEQLRSGPMYRAEGIKTKRLMVPSGREVIPKGCKEWLFDKDGMLPNQAGINNGEVVFRCLARTGIKAKEKFDRWESNQVKVETAL